ncbi:P-loop containing nucleoside triphosphate hydrolase protein [Dactylonectria macrodidyma]|uniref:P-loop containing nucleoside triphosphate hydrolase protein n=1 Tax=Dactylonectria macrodidyma TaxID=307937 RepID=A0A9P9JRE2_9HYPO|nr:P-loop containing nucleoside triphosphate hydrolase protein [Dactylonectria macrodidyma]
MATHSETRVIGDQKSGKSSVLEAICRVPFPVDEALCTRFPTEVVQRKSAEEAVAVTIKVTGRRDNHQALTGFYKKLSSSDSAGLTAAMQEASSLILSTPSVPGGRNHFSDDILKITVSGPGRYPLTVVDLPGLFYSSTKEQDQKDKVTVERMVRRYLRQPRNALLLVVPSRTSWPTMLAPAEIGKPGADPHGLRTLGIITGLDTSWSPQEHGWHCLRNRSKGERDRGEDRDAIEAAYFSHNWAEIDEACKGIANLRPKLSKLLAHHVQFYLPNIISEVRAEIKILNKTHRQLGKRCMSEREQRGLLSRMAVDFQLLCCSAVDGRYGEGTMPIQLQTFFNDPKDATRRCQDKRLQAVVRAMGQLFNSTMIKNGKRTEIVESSPRTSHIFFPPPPPPPPPLRRQPSSLFSRNTHKTSKEDDYSLNRIVTGKERSGTEEGGGEGDGEGESKRGSEKEEREGERRDVREEYSEEYSEEESEEEIEDESEEESEDESEEESEDESEEESEEDSEDESEEGSESPSEDDVSSSGSSEYGILRAWDHHAYRSPSPAGQTIEKFESEVRDMAFGWRGTESLNDVSLAFVSKLICEETSPWRKISRKHLMVVWKAIKRFVHLALKHCVDASFLPPLKRFIVNHHLKKLKADAKRQLNTLLRCHQGMNAAFHDFLGELDDGDLQFGTISRSTKEDVGNQLLEEVKSALSSQAVEKMVQIASHSVGGIGSLETAFANILIAKVKDTLTEAVQGKGAQDDPEPPTRRKLEQAAVRRAIDMTEKYYKHQVSLMSFVAYVNALVIQDGLLQRLPYEIFTNDIVSRQEVETIFKIAGEKEDTAKKRLECEKKLAILKKALTVFKDYRAKIS